MKVIAKWLADNDRSREWLAATLGVSLATFRRRLKRMRPDDTFTLALSKITGLPVETLVGHKAAAKHHLSERAVS